MKLHHSALALLTGVVGALFATRASAANGPEHFSFKLLAGAMGARGYVDGRGIDARFDDLGGMAADAAGNLYLSERSLNVIRKISPQGVVTTIAGTAGQGGAQDGLGAAARFAGPSAVAVDRAGNVFVADTGNNLIRKIDPAGNVTTCAGKAGVWGRVDGPKEVGRLGSPTCVAVDDAGNLFVYDDTSSLYDRRWLRRISADGTVSSLTISENRFIAVRQICVDPSGNLYVTIREAGPGWDLTTVHKLTPTAETGHYSDTNLNPPDAEPWIRGIASDGTGRIFARDLRNHTHVFIPDIGWQMRSAPGTSDWTGDPETYDHVAVHRSGKFFLFRNDPQSPRGAVEVEVSDRDPEILLQPRSQVIAAGRTAAFNVGTSGTSLHQWTKDGVEIPGATNATLVLPNASAASAGTYRCIAVNSSGATTSDAATLSVVNTIDSGRISGVSVRADLFAAARLMAGIVVSGGTKPVLFRAIGPGLQPFTSRFTVLKDDPRLEIYDADGTLLQANNDWGGDATLARAFTTVGAFPLATESRDAALLRTFNGPITAHVFGNSYGMVLFEVYEAGGDTASRLTNLSARAPISDRNGTLIAGIVVAGATSQTVLVRAIGPALAAFGVSDALLNPKLEIYNAEQVRLAENDNWPRDLAATADRVGAFALPAGSKDAALLITLAPGLYTAVLSGVDGATGEALIEMYDVP